MRMRGDRFEQLLGGFAEDVPPAPAGSGGGEEADATGAVSPSAPEPELVPAEDRLTRLERELTELRAELASLREALGEDPTASG